MEARLQCGNFCHRMLLVGGKPRHTKLIGDETTHKLPANMEEASLPMKRLFFSTEEGRLLKLDLPLAAPLANDHHNHSAQHCAHDPCNDGGWKW